MFGLLMELLGTAGMFYIAMIYHSESMLYLTIWIFLLVILMCINHLLRLGKIRVILRADREYGERGDVLPVKLEVENRGKSPVHKMFVLLEVRYVLSGAHQKELIRCSVPGRKQKQSCAKQTVELQLQPQITGAVQIQVKRVICYDFFGILGFHLRRKKTRQKETVTILPEQETIGLLQDGADGIVSMDREVDVSLYGEKNPPEISEIREYRPGDRIHSIHWKLSAKQDDLMVYEFRSEQLPTTVVYLESFWKQKDTEHLEKKKKRKRHFRKKERRRQQEQWLHYIQRIYSVSSELLEEDRGHYLAYLDGTTGKVCRTVITEEEELYAFVRDFTSHTLAVYGSIDALREQYLDIYRMNGRSVEYVLREDGDVTYA